MGHSHFKCFSMSGEVLWQVKPNGHAPPLTEDLQLGLASKASTDEGMHVANAPVIGGQSQEWKEEHVEELANNGNEAGQNTLATPSNTVIDITSCVVP